MWLLVIQRLKVYPGSLNTSVCVRPGVLRVFTGTTVWARASAFVSAVSVHECDARSGVSFGVYVRVNGRGRSVSQSRAKRARLGPPRAWSPKAARARCRAARPGLPLTSVVGVRGGPQHLRLVQAAAQRTHAPRTPEEGVSPRAQRAQLFHAALFGPSVLKPHLGQRRGRELGVRSAFPSAPHPRCPCWVLTPLAHQAAPEAGPGGIRPGGWRGASENQPRVKDFADPWGDS